MNRPTPSPRSPVLYPFIAAGALGMLVAACGPPMDPSDGPAGAASGQSATPRSAGATHADRIAARIAALEKEVGLRADQRARVATLALELHQKAAPLRALHIEAAKELGRQIRAGKLDRVQLRARVGRLQQTLGLLRPEVNRALEELHRVLDSDQRDRLLTSLKRHRHRGPFGPPPGGHGPLTEELKLTEDQEDQIHDVILDAVSAQRREVRPRLRSLHRKVDDAAAAFRSSRFDASRLELLSEAPKVLSDLVERAANVADPILALLSAPQRATLALLIEKHAEAATTKTAASLPSSRATTSAE